MKETRKPVNKNCEKLIVGALEHCLALTLSCSSHTHSFNIDSTVSHEALLNIASGVGDSLSAV